MGDWFTQTPSHDISFCKTDCKNLKCHRNKNGKHLKSLLDYWKKNGISGFYSMSDFGYKCDSKE